jgi:hypothetical protein
MHRVSTMKRPDFIVQVFYNEKPLFWRCFKIGKLIFLGAKCLLRTTGI